MINKTQQNYIHLGKPVSVGQSLSKSPTHICQHCKVSTNSHHSVNQGKHLA